MPKMISTAIIVYLFIIAPIEAATPKARARVDVALALVEAAETQPELSKALPDLPPVPADSPTNAPPDPADDVLRESPPPGVEQSLPVVSGISFTPINANPVAGAVTGKRTVYAYTGEAHWGSGWCTKCTHYKKRFGNGNDECEVIWSDKLANGPQVYPAFRFLDAEGKERYPAGKITGDYKLPVTLQDLVECIDRNVPRQKIEAEGIAGSFKASAVIAQAKSLWKEHIGVTKADGTPVKLYFTWLRTGGSTFKVLHGDPKQLTVHNVYGDLGSFTFSAPGSKLPIDPVVLSYKRVGDKIRATGEADIPIKMFGLPGDQDKTFGVVQPAGFGPLTILTVVNVISTIYQLFNPSLDLTSGATVSFEAFYDAANDRFDLTFKDGPTAILNWLFTFPLKIERVLISDHKIDVFFSGSMWIKSRSFSVE